MKSKTKGSIAVSCTGIFRFTSVPTVVYFLILSHVWCKADFTFSILSSVRDNCCMANSVVIRNLLKRKVLGSNYAANCKLTASLVTTLICITIFSWILTILMLSGDIHPNPGPASLSSLTSGSESSAASFLPMNFTNLSNHLSFLHYNVQSLAPKLDILGPELFEFDILTFSETWLKPSISSDDLHLHSFRTPERKDRTGDSHGGVIIYVKEDIYYKRRLDLEPRGTECI